jgi:hypothetical protein
VGSAWDGLVNNERETQLPHYALSKKLAADSYFTSASTAEKCVNIFFNEVDADLSAHKFVEPSAGHGAFYDLLPPERRIGIELHGRRKSFIKKDFLKWYPPTDTEQKYVVVGNPPFGVRGALALAFVNRSLLFSDYVAFILPMSFHSNGKGSNMRRVANGHLIFSTVLEGEQFYSPDTGKDIKVNALFQVWKRGTGPSIFPDYNIDDYAAIYTVCSSPDRLCGLDKIGVYDFFVSSSYFGDNLKTVYDFGDVKYGSGYGIILKKDKEKIMENMREVEWDDYSSMATNQCKHIRKYSIEKCLYDMGFGYVV